LEGEVQARAGEPGPSFGTIIKRDLKRYYDLLNQCRQRLRFSLPEAEAIVLALGPDVKTPSQYIWAEVERQYLENSDDPDHHAYYYLPDDLDAAVLVEKLRKLGPVEAHALRDAAEIYWATQRQSSLDPFEIINTWLLTDLHLTSPEALKNATERRAKEKGVIRDPAANLRRGRQPEAEEA